LERKVEELRGAGEEKEQPSRHSLNEPISS
jgi:hypothetical protein